MWIRTLDLCLVRRPWRGGTLFVALLFAAPAPVLAGLVAVGAAPGNAPRMQVFDAATRRLKFDFLAFNGSFRGGVNVAVGDINGDGTPDVVATPGPGGAPIVKVFNGRTGLPLDGPLNKLLAFSKTFRGGVYVATGDVNGDGKADVIAGAGPGGAPRVKVFSGADGSILASFLAFDASFQGGVRVAAADFRHRLRADIVTATGPGATGSPRVRIFSGDRAALLADRGVFSGRRHSGLSVSTGDLNHDGTVDLIVGSAAGGRAVVTVFDGLTTQVLAALRVGSASFDQQLSLDVVDADNDTFDDLLVALGTAGSPVVRAYKGASGQVLGRYRAFGKTYAGTAAVAGSAEHGRGTNFAAAQPVTREVRALSRLYQYVPVAATHPQGQYVPVAAGGVPPNKHVYVVTHGWAPGYRAWVDQYVPKHVLKWWETAGYNGAAYPPPDPSPGPDSVWMFQAYTQDNLPISPSGGLAQQIIAADPAAVVLAYSWLDDSATTAALDNAIPEQAYWSEALTNINGFRLATALRQALGTAYSGSLHLLGHSHGSKVATLAAVALQQWGDLAAEQLTVFDSPESEPTDDLNAANFLWYYFGQLPLSRKPGSGLFVDSYYSAFGESYADMTIGGQQPLGAVVDTQLYAYPYSVSSLDDPGDWHAYPPAWYAQANKLPCSNGDTNGGLAWSPLLGYDPGTLPSEWEQAWNLLDFSAANQSCLAQPFFPSGPSVTYDDLVVMDADTSPAAPVTSIALGLGAGQDASFDGTYQKDFGSSGIAFDYTFSGADRGLLQIQINDYLAYYIDSQYLPPGVTQHVTVNIGWPTLSQSIAITLRPPPGVLSNAQVTLTNFQQFEVASLGRSRSRRDSR